MPSAWRFQLPDTVDSLVLDLLEWIGPGCRPYDEVLDAWRTSCPRLPVWEAANERAYIVRRFESGGGEVLISLSPAGELHLHRHRPSAIQAVPTRTH